MRKKLDLDDVEVRILDDRAYLHYCASCAERSSRIDRITRTLAVGGHPTDEQGRRLVPIHSIIHGSTAMEQE